MSVRLLPLLNQFLLPLLDPILNTPQSISHVVFDIPVMKSQDLESEVLQTLLSSLILFKVIAMAIPVDFDYQIQLRAIEIYDVFVNGPLPQEGVGQHFTLFQLVPQQ